ASSSTRSSQEERPLASAGAKREFSVAELVEFRARVSTHPSRQEHVRLAEPRIVDHLDRAILASHEIDQVCLAGVAQHVGDRGSGESDEVARGNRNADTLVLEDIAERGYPAPSNDARSTVTGVPKRTAVPLAQSYARSSVNALAFTPA